MTDPQSDFIRQRIQSHLSDDADATDIWVTDINGGDNVPLDVEVGEVVWRCLTFDALVDNGTAVFSRGT